MSNLSARAAWLRQLLLLAFTSIVWLQAGSPTWDLSTSSPLLAADWPMWRGDAARGGATTEELPEKLQLHWVLELSTPRPAWPSTQDKLQFDRFYEPIVAGGRVFIPSMIRDSVSAYDLETASLEWTFYTGGPVRFAPLAFEDRLFVASDDGFLYCLGQDEGDLIWKFRGGPNARRVLGNERMISMWPARGGPVLYDGSIYFGAGLWPFMGIFLHALDARSGEVLWTQSGEGSTYQTQQHNSPAFSGVAPQGYLAATKDRLIVAGGRTIPAVYDRHTGRFLHYNVASRKMGSKGGGGYQVSAAGNYYLNRGAAYRMDNGHFLQGIDALVTTDQAVVGRDGSGICAYSTRWEEHEETDRKGKKTKKIRIKKIWSTPLDTKIERVFLLAGSRLYCRGEGNAVVAVDIGNLFTGARKVWEDRLNDEPLNMIAADSKLIVTTHTGRIFCYGAPVDGKDIVQKPQAVDKDAPPTDPKHLVRKGSEWRYLDNGKDPAENWRQLSFDDSSWKSGPARLGYGGDGETTKVSYGSDDKRKHLATFFRCKFEANEEWLTRAMELQLLADDGAVVWLNGQEIARLRVPEKYPDARTQAEAASSDDEKQFTKFTIEKASLREGENVLAVSVHQANRTSSDLGFDLSLAALPEKQAVVRNRRLPALDLPADAWRSRAEDLLSASTTDAGYVLVLGVGSGRLAEEIVVGAEVQVVVLEKDATRADEFRRHLDALGIYGEHVAVVVGDLADTVLPQYFADLITTESLADQDFGTDKARDAALLQTLWRSLRPFSGAACLPLSDVEHERFASLARSLDLDHGVVERVGRHSLLRRTAAPSGSANWTHQYGDAANTVASRDRVVRAPLGLLWFGGPSNEGVLPRHGHGPTPQVVDGRCFIEGRDMIRATDIYTGRFLWERQLKDIGKDYDYTSHEPGANILGSNYVSLPDAVYVAFGNECLVLDPATGATTKTFTLPAAGEDKPPLWGYIGASGNWIIGGAQPNQFTPPDFTKAEIGKLKDDPLKKAKSAIRKLVNFKVSKKRRRQSDHDWIREHVNRLLLSDDMLRHIPLRTRHKAGAEGDEDALKKYLSEVKGREPTDYEALVIKRKLLHRYFGLPKYERKAAGKMGSLEKSASKRLVVLDRRTGEVAWDRQARHQIRHNTIVAGDGKIFWIDKYSAEEIAYWARRGKKIASDARLRAARLSNGETLWKTGEGVFGTWLGYSAEHDLLVQAGSNSRDRSPDEVGRGITVYDGTTGEIVWKNRDKYAGPCIILGDRLITQGYDKAGHAYELKTGERVRRGHPLTGQPTDWTYVRNYGCNTAIGAPNLLTFRSAAAGFYDLLSDVGTGNLGGFRSGCTSNLIPAGGILCAPDYTRTCTCSYQNQASLALVHMPEAEMWTFSSYSHDPGSTREVGINFGAPGDRRAPGGVLWLDAPSVGGNSPDLPVELTLEGRQFHRYHASRFEGQTLPWVGASAVEGSGTIAVTLEPIDRFRVANQVDGGPALSAKTARLDGDTPKVPTEEGAKPDASVQRSLRKGKKKGKVEARIEKSAALALRGSFTVEFWARAGNDYDYIDARVSSEKSRHGFVIDNRELRLRYYVENEDGDDNEDVITLSKKDHKVPDKKWFHVAFTYDREDGKARLWLDGKRVDSHDGRNGRSIWWETDRPEWAILKDADSEDSYLDDLRITNRVLDKDEFLNASSQVRRKGLIGLWRMNEYSDIEKSKAGDANSERFYAVRLIFAELDGAEAGERVFDVELEGAEPLRDLDVVREAGGPFRVLEKRFEKVPIDKILRLRLSQKSDRKPILSGIEVIRQSRSF